MVKNRTDGIYMTVILLIAILLALGISLNAH